MLLTLTPHMALDRTLIAPGFRQADVCRVLEVRPATGGKGVNVARVARELGYPVRLCGPLAGVAGQQVAALAVAEELDATWAWLPSGETRTCTILIDPVAHDDIAVNERGPQVDEAGWEELAQLVRREATRADALACCGSLPPGIAPTAYLRLLDELATAGRRVLLDTSGEVLRLALDLPLAMIKVNAAELGEALDRVITSPEDAFAAADAVRTRGPQQVVVTLGAQGAVAVGDEGRFVARPPAIRVISPVGSGDALLAGLTVALLRGQPLPEALRLGVACGSVNALHMGGGVVTADEIATLTPQVDLRAM